MIEYSINPEANDDAFNYERELARGLCWLCGGTGMVIDVYGEDAVPCPECAETIEDAIADAIIPEPGMPF